MSRNSEPMRVVVMGERDARRAALMEKLQAALDAAGIAWKRGVDGEVIESVVICDE